MTHVTRITKAGATHPIEPQSVVLLDPVTGNPYTASSGGGTGLTDAQLRASAVPVSGPATVKDSTGALFDPDACTHAYAYSNGLLTTDTATDGGATWVKTYSYTSGSLTGETKWVRQ